MSGAAPAAAPAEILVDRSGPLLRAATLRDGQLTDLQLDHAARPSRLGAVFLGRVERIVPGLDAAFIDIGEGRAGLIGASDLRLPGAGSRKAARAGGGQPIGRLLRAGQELLVQVKAEPGGGKGPTLTMDMTLPGRFLVMTPMTPGLSISRRLGRDPGLRAALARRVEAVAVGGGWIVRAQAAAVPDAVLAAEAESLALAWRAIEQGAAAGAAPRLLLAGPDAARRAVVEQGGRAISAIRVAEADLHRELAAWAADAAPDLVPVLSLHRGPEPLFERHGLEEAISGLGGRRVDLAGGGWIAVDRTEAMTVVDVNGGERGNALSTNLAAAEEVARQLRLRNLGGIVVVDFIDMKGAGERERLVQALSAAVAEDPAGVQVYGLTRLGLVEMTRGRRGPEIPELLALAGSGPLDHGGGDAH
ncbi:ribonuclease E/G [Arenibaculum pallidiluteum]|uniref:ribonuclease E/G n=1 Tax=Arenibaculum pallidiluteum TaxID=2812559 RepID=UPI001A9745A9|nr:ribonuclease E/G [Arenibaculum pallidiluteum]